MAPGSKRTTNAQRATVAALVGQYGQTFADQIGIALEKNTPAPLFQLLCAAMLYSARIPAANATRAMRALLDAGLTTPAKMADATWQRRVDVLTSHGYKRYDERTSTMLGETATRVRDHYRGDLRRLRDEADRDVDRERALLQQFKGIGPVGANIFLREVQIAWPEVFPYADERALQAARGLGLPGDAPALCKLAGRKTFPHLVAALVRVALDGGHRRVGDAR